MTPQTQGDLRLFHKLLPVIFIPVSLYLIVEYAWIGFATISGRPGLYGHYFIYYQLTSLQFFIYNFMVAIDAAALLFFQVKYIVQKNPKYLTIIFWVFAIFITLLIICEYYINTRFIGKG